MRRIAILLMLISFPVFGQSTNWQGLPVTNNDFTNNNWYPFDQAYHPFSQFWYAASERYTAARDGWPLNQTNFLVDPFTYVSSYSNQAGVETNVVYYTNATPPYATTNIIPYFNVVPVYTTTNVLNALDFLVRSNQVAVTWTDETNGFHTGTCYIARDYFRDLTCPYAGLFFGNGNNFPAQHYVLTNWMGTNANWNHWFSLTNHSGVKPSDFPVDRTTGGNHHADLAAVFYCALGISNVFGNLSTDEWGAVHGGTNSLEFGTQCGFSRDTAPRSMLIAQASATNGGWAFTPLLDVYAWGDYFSSVQFLTNPVIIYNTTGAMPTVSVTVWGGTNIIIGTPSPILGFTNETITFSGTGTFTRPFIVMTNIEMSVTNPGDSVTIMYTNGVRFFFGFGGYSVNPVQPYSVPQELDKNDFNERQAFLDQFVWATLPCTWGTNTIERTWTGAGTSSWAEALSLCEAATPTTVTNSHPPGMWTLSRWDGSTNAYAYQATCFASFSYPVVGDGLSFSTSTNCARDVDWYMNFTTNDNGLYDTTNTFATHAQTVWTNQYMFNNTTAGTHAAPCTNDIGLGYPSAVSPATFMTWIVPTNASFNRTGWKAIDPPRALLRFHFKYY